ncbi:Hypothetical protein FKW44_021321, partial [Caligus rogercresseyi]
EDIWAIRIKTHFMLNNWSPLPRENFHGSLELLKAVKSCGPHWKKMASSGIHYAQGLPLLEGKRAYKS